MANLSNVSLWVFLFFLIILSGFFSACETAMMSLNRYKLRHMARVNKQARRALKLLERPDRLLGVILIANNFTDIMASAIVTLLTVRIFGNEDVLLATLSVTLLALIFAEVTPKTLAALHPNAVAFPSAIILEGLLKIIYPLVWLTNGISNGFLKLFGIAPHLHPHEALSVDELKHLVNEGSDQIPLHHRTMLLSVFDLEKTLVKDVMIHRTEIIGLDLNQPWQKLLSQLKQARHSTFPVYKGNINEPMGFLSMQHALNPLIEGTLNEKTLSSLLTAPYFIPETTPLHTQLLQFQSEKRNLGLVVNEYGDIVGLLTLVDLLEEIVGEFTVDHISHRPVFKKSDGSYIVKGSALIRDLNRQLHWNIPSLEAKTLGGAISTYLQTTPEGPLCLQLENYNIEVLEVLDQTIRLVKIQSAYFKIPSR